MIRIETSHHLPLVERWRETVRNLSGLTQSDSQVLQITAEVTPISLAPLIHLGLPKRARKAMASKTHQKWINREFSLDNIALAGLPSSSEQLWVTTLQMKAESSPSLEAGIAVLIRHFLDALAVSLSGDPDFSKQMIPNVTGFLLDELLANVLEHARATRVSVGAKCWLDDEVCEIIVLDDGQGLYESLRTSARDVSSHLDALTKVVRHQYSSKQGAGVMERGTGLMNARALAVNDVVRGEFSILSGNALYCGSAGSGESLTQLSGFEWNGVIVSVLFQKPSARFELYDFIR